MDISRSIGAFEKPFAIDKNTFVRMGVYFAMGAILSLLVNIRIYEGGIAFSISAVAIYLCIAALPMGWGGVAVIAISIVSAFFGGFGIMNIAGVIVNAAALIIGNMARWSCGNSKIKIEIIVIAWVGFITVAGTFCYSAMCGGVPMASIDVLVKLLEWAICAAIYIVVVAFAQTVSPEARLFAAVERIGLNL